MLHVDYFICRIIRPALAAIGADSQDAECLVLLTGFAESNMRVRRQFGGGPALSFFQIEPATHDDIWDNFLRYREDLATKIRGLIDMRSDSKTHHLEYNDKYAAAVCRVHYMRVKERIPDYNDLEGIAKYWKKYYNTEAGKGTVDKFVSRCKGAHAEYLTYFG